MYTMSMPKAPHGPRGTVEVGVRDLRNHLSRWLDAVAEGREIVVTDRGRPVARLVGVDGGAAYDRLVAQGLIQPPRAPRTRIDPTKLVKSRGASVSDLVKEQRR